jgi:hypothetical protein
VHRLRLLLDLARPAQLRAALRVNRVSGTLGGALRCGASVALALAVVAAAGHRDLAGYAALGALASLYARDAGLRWRATLMGLAGASLTAAVTVTSAVVLLGAPVAAEVAALALLAGVATAATALLRTGPPGGTILVFAAGAGAVGAIPTGVGAGAEIGMRAAATAVGALVAVAVCCAGPVVTRLREGRSAVAGDPGHDATDHLAATGAAARPARRPDPRGVRDALRAAPPLPSVLASATMVAVAGALAATVATLVGRGHPAWAVMGATAVLQGAHVHHMGVRALQRAAGTACGVAVAWPLLGAGLGFVATAAVVVALQVLTELVVARHYGLAMLTITPMALLMTSLGGSPDPTTLVLDRAVDTAVGALVGVLVAVAAARPDGSHAPAGGTTGTAQTATGGAVTGTVAGR